MNIARRSRPRNTRSVQGPVRQQGVVLVIALIVLVALMLASISIVRTVDTANVIAGNLAFKQAAVQAGDFGIEAAATALPSIVAAAESDVLPGASGTPAYWYYATRRDADANGIPTTRAAGAAGAATPINWPDVPVATTVAGNAVQVVIDRLCLGPAPVNIQARCFYEGSTDGGTKKIGATVFTEVTAVHYRVTARVSGPRNTVSVVQAIVSR
jgi:Tfp pilus assembly protein PilX